MIRRPRRSTPATLVALVVLAAAVLTATCAIQLLLHRRQVVSYRTLADALHRTRWTDVPVTIGAAVAVAVGLILLLVAALPGRATVLARRPADTDNPIDTGISRRSLRRALLVAAESVDGVNSARIRLRRRAITARARTQRVNTDGLAESVRSAIETVLASLGPAVEPTVRVRLHVLRSTQ